MFSIKWQKKNASLKRSTLFEEEDEFADLEEYEQLEKSLSKKQKAFDSLGKEEKGQQLRNIGIFLAENERFWEAISKWDEALLLLPNDETIFEMKAQSLMELNEIFPAVEAAQKSVELKSNWFVAHQTLGRALLNIGEIECAIRSFCKAIHLNPEDEESRDDLKHALSLLTQKYELEKQKLISDGDVSQIEMQ